MTKKWATACHAFSLVFLGACRAEPGQAGWLVLKSIRVGLLGGHGSAVWISTEKGCSAQPLRKDIELQHAYECIMANLLFQIYTFAKTHFSQPLFHFIPKTKDCEYISQSIDQGSSMS